MIMTNDTEYLTIPQAAKKVGVSRTIIERWIASGAIRQYRRFAGSYPLLRREEVEAAARIVPDDDPPQPS